MEGAEYFQPGFCSQFANENRQSSDANKTTVLPPSATADHFIVEDLLDFSNDDDVVFTDGTFDNQTPTSTDSSTLTLLDSCNSYPNFEQHNNAHNYNFADANFSTDLGVPVITNNIHHFLPFSFSIFSNTMSEILFHFCQFCIVLCCIGHFFSTMTWRSSNGFPISWKILSPPTTWRS